MKILSVLTGRHVGTCESHGGYTKADAPPGGITAATFVITTDDATSDRFVAYAFNGSTGAIEYTVEGERARIPELTRLFTSTVELVATGVIAGPVPQPHPGDPPFVITPGPGNDHPVVALATIIDAVFASIERLPAPPVR